MFLYFPAVYFFYWFLSGTGKDLFIVAFGVFDLTGEEIGLISCLSSFFGGTGTFLGFTGGGGGWTFDGFTSIYYYSSFYGSWGWI